MIFASKLVYGTWDFGGSLCYLVFKSNQQFVAVTGEVVQPGVYRRVIVAVVGRDRTVPLIAGIPATTDAMPSDATWEIYFEDAQHTERDVWISGAILPHTYPDPVEWADIINFNSPPGFIAGPVYGVSFDQMVLYVTGRISQISGDTVATGIGTLAMGLPTTILDSHVTADSPIEAIARGDGITGNLRVSNRVAGVSFDVTSENGADAGNFTWIIRP